MSIKFLFLAAFFALLAPIPLARAAAPGLMVPVACTIGVDCWIVNYVDTDPAPDKFADYQCGQQSYDEHRGTDFAIRDRAAIATGYEVLAVAAGTVLRARDEIEDRQPSDEDIEKMLADNRGCGNGVVIDHGDGLQTIYCHMKQGSIVVKPDEKVAPGQRIGMVGQSGAAEFPHLHFGVFKDGKTIDPFTGEPETADCHTAENSLWLPGLNLAYNPLTLVAAGFSDTAPSYDDVQQNAGNPDFIAASATTLAFWGMLNSVAAGDRLHLRITAPDGSVFAERNITQEERKARQFYYIGKRAANGLIPGPYTGTMTAERTQSDGQIVKRQIGRAIYVQ